MFSDLTAEMKENLQTTLPKTAYTDKDDMIPVMADPKVDVLSFAVGPLLFFLRWHR